VLGASGFFITPVSVPYMGVATKLVTISASHPAGTDIKITHPISAPPSSLRFQVMLKRNGVWQPPVTIAGQEMTFCADSAANRIQQVAMVLSNAEYTDFTTVQTGGWDVGVASGPCVPPPAPPGQFSGTLTLEYFKDFGSGTETTSISVGVTATVVGATPGGSVTGTLVSVSGNGSFVSAFPGLCNRPPETKGGTASLQNFPSVHSLLTLQFEFIGTRTSTFCTQTGPGSVTQLFSGSLPEGAFLGTPVFSGGTLIAIDYNQTTTTSNGGSKVTTGRLQ